MTEAERFRDWCVEQWPGRSVCVTTEARYYEGIGCTLIFNCTLSGTPGKCIELGAHGAGTIQELREQVEAAIENEGR